MEVMLCDALSSLLTTIHQCLGTSRALLRRSTLDHPKYFIPREWPDKQPRKGWTSGGHSLSLVQSGVHHVMARHLPIKYFHLSIVSVVLIFMKILFYYSTCVQSQTEYFQPIVLVFSTEIRQLSL